MTISLYAQPYDIDATGFYFSTLEEYETKAGARRNHYGMPVEEYEIQLIDGTTFPVEPDQTTLADWFDWVAQYEGLSEYEAIGFEYLTDCVGYSAEDALLKAECVCVFEGTPVEYAEDLVSDGYDLPEFAARYFDYTALAHDLVLNGDIHGMENGYIVTNCYDF